MFAFCLALGFIWRELHAPKPFMNLRKLNARPRIIVVFAVYAAANLVFFSVLTGLPTWLQVSLHLTPFSSGVASFPISILGVLITLVAGDAVYARRQQLVTASALVSMCIGSVLMSVLAPTMTLPIIIVDGTKNRSKKYCSLTCLQRDKVRKYRTRQRAQLEQNRQHTLMTTSVFSYTIEEDVTTTRLHS